MTERELSKEEIQQFNDVVGFDIIERLIFTLRQRESELKRLHELTDGDPDTIYHEAAELRNEIVQLRREAIETAVVISRERDEARAALASLRSENERLKGVLEIKHGSGGELLDELASLRSSLEEYKKADTLKALRTANIKREKVWDPDGKIDLAFRGNELAGEVGEACNIIKKILRERMGLRGHRATTDDLAQELADVVICADLIAMDESIDLATAVQQKFNATSEKYELPIVLKTEVTQ